MRTLIVDRPRARSPLLSQFYAEMCDQGDARITNRVNDTLQDVISPMYEPDKWFPDVIYSGFIPWDFVNKNKEFIVSHGIKVVIESMDNRSFGLQENFVGCREVPIAAVVTRSRMDYDKLEERVKNEPCLQGAKIIYTPWASWPEEYRGLPWAQRDIDVLFMGNGYGKRAEYAQQIFASAQEDLHVVAGCVHNELYRAFLERTRLVVIMGVFNTFVQKFVEAGLSGCAIMGECPDEARDLLHDAMFPLPPDYPHLSRAIRALMVNSDPTLVQETAALCHERMSAKRNLHFTMQRFLTELERVVR